MAAVFDDRRGLIAAGEALTWKRMPNGEAPPSPTGSALSNASCSDGLPLDEPRERLMVHAERSEQSHGANHARPSRPADATTIMTDIRKHSTSQERPRAIETKHASH